MEKRTVFSQVDCPKDGRLRIRIEKLILDGERVEAMRYHSFPLEPGVSIDAQLADVHAHIAEEGYPPLAAADVARIRSIATVEHTPERVAKFRADRQAAETRGGGRPA